MAIEERHELNNVIRDARTIEQRVFDFLSNTHFSTGLLVLFAAVVWFVPWTLHLLIPLGFLWWIGVTSDVDRQTLPLYLPKSANRVDLNDKLPGTAKGYAKAGGISFLGNTSKGNYEVWETKNLMTQHRLVLGTTGSGKTELLMGFVANALLMGAGVIFSDAKGTKEQISKVYGLCRAFGRDDDFFSINYMSDEDKGKANAARYRLTNTMNPVAIASSDQINQMFQSFLPEKGGDNQIFLDRAIAMFSAITPALCDLRDLHNEFLDIASIRKYASSLPDFLELAADRNQRLTERSRGALRNYLAAGLGINLDDFNKQSNPREFKVSSEGTRSWTYASQYFVRALASLTESYGDIYLVRRGEVSYKDAVYNRRIVLITLPALSKAPSELTNIARINLAGVRAAINSAASGRVEGDRKDTIDILPTKGEFPAQVILDEYGYQATDGTAILNAQARGLNFSITIAGQDFSNIKAGNEREADAIFGSSVLYAMGIRNTSEIGRKVEESQGYVDVATQDRLERDYVGPVYGYLNEQNAHITRRYRVEPSDLMKLGYGEAFIFPGRNIRPIQYKPFAPLPDVSDYYEVGRYLTIAEVDPAQDENLIAAAHLDQLVLARLEARSDPVDARFLGEALAMIIQGGRDGGPGNLHSSYIKAILAVGRKPNLTPTLAPAHSAKAISARLEMPQAGMPGSPSRFGAAHENAPMGMPLVDTQDRRVPPVNPISEQWEDDLPPSVPPRTPEVRPVREVREDPPAVPERTTGIPRAAVPPPPFTDDTMERIRSRSAADLFAADDLLDQPFDQETLALLNQSMAAADGSLGLSRSGTQDLDLSREILDGITYQGPNPPPPPRSNDWLRGVLSDVLARTGAEGAGTDGPRSTPNRGG